MNGIKSASSHRRLRRIAVGASSRGLRVGLLGAALACGLSLSAVPASATSALPATTATSPAKLSKSVCSVLDNSSASAKFAAQVEADVKSKNFPALKQLFVNLVTDMAKASTESALNSAPASVKAALKTIESYLPTLKAAIEKATTQAELLAAFVAMGKDHAVAEAEGVLNKYAISVCGG